jgi:glucose/arabinose dehydrogenase
MSRPRLALPALVLSLSLVLAACSDDPDEGSASAPPASSSSTGSPSSSAETSPSGPAVTRATVTGVVARDLEAPWGMAFLPDGSALVTERDSDRIVRVTADGDVSAVGRVRGVDGDAEGGLLGIALSPTYDEDQTIFVYYTAGDENVIARITYDGSKLSDQKVVFDGIPAAAVHDGGRIAFGPDGFLYVGTGEAGRRDPAQDRDDLGGKILRITAVGKPAPGNPFDGSPVYSLGHRNVQGLAWDSRGQLWAAEFGQNTWDELNRIKAGANYGWPVVEGRSDDDEFVNPVRQWSTDKASPSGIAIAGDSVFMAGLRGQRLWQIPIPNGKPSKPRALLSGKYGRLRAVTQAPDGSLWVLTNNTDGRGSPRSGDDKVVRLTLS